MHVIDRVLIPPQLERCAIASQAYREKDVKERAMGGEAQFSARLLFAHMLRESEALGDEAAIC